MKVRSDTEVGARIGALLGGRPQRELAEAVAMQPSVLSRALAGERAFNMSEPSISQTTWAFVSRTSFSTSSPHS